MWVFDLIVVLIGLSEWVVKVVGLIIVVVYISGKDYVGYYFGVIDF